MSQNVHIDDLRTRLLDVDSEVQIRIEKLLIARRIRKEEQKSRDRDFEAQIAGTINTQFMHARHQNRESSVS